MLEVEILFEVFTKLIGKDYFLNESAALMGVVRTLVKINKSNSKS